MKTIAIMGSFSVADIDKAVEFYANTLGLQVKKDESMGIMHISQPEGGQVLVYPKGPAHKPAEFTVLNLMVTNFEALVDELTAKGVQFEHYDNEYIKTNEKGIAVGDENSGGASIAWFTDPDGNILSLIEDTTTKA